MLSYIRANDRDDYEHKRTYSKWTKSAIYCDDSGQDCKNCDIAKFYGANKDWKCHMPEALHILKDRNIQRGPKISFKPKRAWS